MIRAEVERGAWVPPPPRHRVAYEDPDRASKAFGQRVRELRATEGLSQDGLAHTSGIHLTSIGRIERDGREPRLTTIQKLAEGLGVEPGELTNGLDDGASAWI